MKSLLLFAFLMSATLAQASQGLTVNALEFGVGKFHRFDNQTHAYDAKNAWLPYVLPQNAATDTLLSVDNADGSVTLFFSTLDDLISGVVAASKAHNLPVNVLNVHGHGTPGAMWFPPDNDALHSSDCSDWVTAASGSDEDNYNQYYSPVMDFEIQQIRDASNTPGFKMGCTTGLDEWKAGVAKNAAFTGALSNDVQVHFLSCVVGLGSVGEAFTQGVADLLAKPQGRVETSMDFGLGDWSMPQGMGFWDMQSSDQLDHDNTVYPKDKKDAEIAQKGTIRMAVAGSRATSLLGNRDFMVLTFESAVRGTPIAEVRQAPYTGPVPARIRVPGTTAYVTVSKR